MSFSNATQLNVRIPPETIGVFLNDPGVVLLSLHNVYRARILKIRETGSLLNLVLATGGVELNALLATQPGCATAVAVGDWVYVAISPAALSTEPHKGTKGWK
jgi:ABC-type molybdate transport system ATPase subunit